MILHYIGNKNCKSKIVKKIFRSAIFNLLFIMNPL